MPPSFAEALRFWFRLGWISFGGTTGHIAIMHDFLVEQKKWISESRFLHALNQCMILPGPEAQQLAIYIGWKLHGLKGGITAGSLFVLPSMLILLALSMVYVAFGNHPWVLSLFEGLKPAIIAIIIVATYKVGRKALKGPLHILVALIAFVASYYLHLSMIPILGITLLLAAIARVLFPALLFSPDKNKVISANENLFFINEFTPMQEQGNRWRSSLRMLCCFVLLWMAPFALLSVWGGDRTFWTDLSLFFTKTAFVTIGGSYTVLPLVAHQTVESLHWLEKTQMLDGFALAETTPGPLIIVLSYVGFMAGYNHFGDSMLMGTIGLLVVTYYTFLPNFLLIFLGAPLMEKARGKQGLSVLLSLVTAAVVGVILNLAFYLGSNILFPKSLALGDMDLLSLTWVLFSLWAILRRKMNLLYLIALSLLFGLLRFWIGNG